MDTKNLETIVEDYYDFVVNGLDNDLERGLITVAEYNAGILQLNKSAGLYPKGRDGEAGNETDNL